MQKTLENGLLSDGLKSPSCRMLMVLVLKSASLNKKYLVRNLYWMKIKYFGRIYLADVSRYPLEGNNSLAWQFLKLGSELVKKGLFWFFFN